MIWPMVKLAKIAPSSPLKMVSLSRTDIVLQITLDHIEAHTGQLLKQNYQSVSIAGPSTHWFDSGYVLYSKLRPNLNKVYLPEEKGIGTSELVTMLPDPKLLDRKYLAYYLRSSEFVGWISGQTAGAKMPRVTMNVFWEHEIPLPPLAEQKRIAAILDKADSIRRKRQQAIKLADDFLRAVFLDMFGDPVTNPKGWDEYTLKNIADIRSGVTKGKKIDLSTSLTLPYMRVANVQDGYLNMTEVKNIVVSPSDAERFILKKGDVLLTEGGDPDKLGRGYVWNNEIDKCLHQNHIFSVRIKDTDLVSPDFLSTLISSQRGKRYFLKVGKQTTGIATINKTVLSDFEPFIPPIISQMNYLRVRNKVRVITSSYGNDGKALFDSLSQKAFAGEL